MSLIFFLKSATVNISKYNIKDIPGSSGRLDVIARCILSALLNVSNLGKNIQIWIFLDNYGTYIFDSNCLNKRFPKNEILMTDFFVEIIKRTNKRENNPKTPLDTVKYSNLSIYDAIRNFVEKDYKIFIMNEKGTDFRTHFLELNTSDDLLFIVGDQSGDLLDSQALKKLNLVNLSLGDRSYLASSTIRLIKMNLQLLI